MFNVKLVDIGGDGLVTDFTITLETLAEVEIFVTGTINQHLGICTAQLIHDSDLVYSVWVNGREIGVCVIKSVNATPRIQKER